MARKNHLCCVVCGHQNSDDISHHKFPTNKVVRKIWISRLPLKNWKLTTSSLLCSRHFLPSDFKENSTDSNKRGTRHSSGDQIKRRLLKRDAIPSIWPGLKNHVAKEKVSRPTGLSLPSERAGIAAAKAMEEDAIPSLECLKTCDVKLPSGVIKFLGDSSVSFVKISTEEVPRIQYSVKIVDSMKYEILWSEMLLEPNELLKEKNIPEKISSLSFLTKLVCALDAMNNPLSEEQMINNLVNKIEVLGNGNRKTSFLCEQLRLVEKKPKARRYSQELLGMACMWRSISAALYKQIQRDDVFTLPDEKYIKRLSSAVTVDYDLSDATKAYLQTRKERLSKKDLSINVIIDEVYVEKSMQYVNGKFYGNENGDLTKTLLCVMIKSVAGDYEDVITMSPISEISATKIYTVWKNVVKCTTELGFDVVATTSDGHRANMKLFKTLLCQGKWKTHIPNPYQDGKKIFLLFDSTHLLKNIYHNFRGKECFVCPPPNFSSDDASSKTNLYPNFAHVRELQHVEMGKPIKIAHKLNDKVINPRALEKTNVKLADALFHESTINALEYYAKNGFPYFEQTAKFLRVIRNWWDTFNVKNKYKGEHKRNEYMQAVTKENIQRVSSYLEEFTSWVTEWKNEFPDFGLSSPTFQALIQTVKATSELCSYLLESENDIEYVLIGFLQQDFLEGRFGWFRQLAGGNYFCSVVQFLQAEKTIRLRNLINSNIKIKDIGKLFASASEKQSLLVKTRGDELSKMLTEFSFQTPTSDVPITYYVSGYVSRQLIKSTPCDGCKVTFSDDEQPLPINIDETFASAEDIREGKMFIDTISRGGLIKPSNLLFVTCMHASDLIQYIQNNPTILRYMYNSVDSRSVFVEAFICKLKENTDTQSILNACCTKGHEFKTNLRKVIGTLFNIFAKNMVTECNNKIHADRKRNKDKTNDMKRDQCEMREKKCKSES